MSNCEYIPGLESEFCKKCNVWVPTDYQIQVLENAVTKSTEALKEWEKGRAKSQKSPKSIMKNIRDSHTALSRATDIKADHTRYANKKELPVKTPKKPTHVRVFQGYSIDKDDDYDLGVLTEQ